MKKTNLSWPKICIKYVNSCASCAFHLTMSKNSADVSFFALSQAFGFQLGLPNKVAPRLDWNRRLGPARSTTLIMHSRSLPVEVEVAALETVSGTQCRLFFIKPD